MGPMNSSGEESQWRAMNQPINAKRTQIVGHDEMEGFGQNRTLDPDGHRGKQKGPKKNPGLMKQFKEPADLTDRQEAVQDLARIRKNNFV